MKLKHFGFWIFHIFFIHSLLLTHTIPSSFQSPLFSTTYSYAHTYIFSKLSVSHSTVCLQVLRTTLLPLLHTQGFCLRRSDIIFLISYWLIISHKNYYSLFLFSALYIIHTSYTHYI